VEALVLVGYRAGAAAVGRDGSWPRSPGSCSACSPSTRSQHSGVGGTQTGAFNPAETTGAAFRAGPRAVVRDAIGTALTNVVLVVIWVGIALLVVAITAGHDFTSTGRGRPSPPRRRFAGLIAVHRRPGRCPRGLSLQATGGGSGRLRPAPPGWAVSQVARLPGRRSANPRRFTEGHPQPDPRRPPSPLLNLPDRVCAGKGRPHRLRRKLRGRVARPGFRASSPGRRRPVLRQAERHA